MSPPTGIGVFLHAASGPGARELSELQRTVATPLPLRRRIGIASLAGGTGCSTVAAGLGLTLASRREGAIMCVDAQGMSPTPIASGGGLTLTSLGADIRPAAITAWWQQLAERQRDYDLTITDWGATPIDRIADITAHSHALCLVTSAERGAIQNALDVAAVASETTGVAIAVNDVHRTARYATGQLVRQLPLPAVLLPHDRRRPTVIQPPRPAAGYTALQLLRLAARLVRFCAEPRSEQAKTA